MSNLRNKSVLLHCVATMVMVIALMACGEDRTYEYEALTERDHWVADVWRDSYLWGDSIKDNKLSWNDYFSSPTDFVTKLKKFAPIEDKWSWCAIDTLPDTHNRRGYFNASDTYGMDFVVMGDPTGRTSRQYARVTMVVTSSPADACGIKRGDFIGIVDGSRMSTTVADKLVMGGKHKLTVQKLGRSEEEENALVWAEEQEKEIAPSVAVKEESFSSVSHYSVSSGRTCAYVVCRNLGAEGENAAAINAAIDKAIGDIAATSPSYVIIDLRYCHRGTLEAACRLASALAPLECEGKTFAKTTYNKRYSDKDRTMDFLSGKPGTLSLRNVFFITDTYTSGAAEWLIRGLKASAPASYVVCFGKPTAGQIVMTEALTTSYHISLHPATCFVADGLGDYDFVKGIQPDGEVNELEYIDFYELGDSREAVLSAILKTL